MNKRKCGTCRFYQEARLASSGWCHHPQRKVTSDLMIMVRKNELACRDEWTHDLWESADAARTAAVSSGQAQDRRQPPATEQEIAALLRADTSSSVAGEPDATPNQDDVVLSELGLPAPFATPARPEPARSWAPVESEPAPQPRVSDAGNRNAIIKAREAYRERSRLLAARSNEIARLAAEADRNAKTADLSPPENSSDLSGRSGDDSALSTAGQSDRPRLDVTTPDSIAADRTKVNPIAAQKSPSDPVPAQNEIRLEDQSFASTDPRSKSPTSGPRFEASGHLDPTIEQLTRPRTTGTRPAASRSDSIESEAEGRSVAHSETPEPDPLIWQDQGWSDDLVTSATDDEHIAPGDESNAVYGRRLTAGSVEDVADDNIGLIADEAESAGFADDLGAGWDSTEIAATSDEPRPVPPIGIAAHLSQICRNCRDFRPAEAGDRGWCANHWAFSHRQMVDATAQTPCESSLGHWWLPVDEVWSEAADVSSHGQPTPLLDAWLLPPLERVPARRRS